MRLTALLLSVFLSPLSQDIAIEIEGSRNVSDQAILAHLQPLLDGQLTDSLLEQAFKQLWDTGLFEDIQFNRETTPAGKILLVVVVEEKPWLRQTRFEGESVSDSREDLKTKLVADGVDLRPRRPFGEEEALRAARTLTSLMGRNYSVTARLESLEPGWVDLVLTVDKRPPVLIETISFKGNETFEDSKLESVMELQPHGWTTRWTKRDRFDSARLDEDLDRLRDFYRQGGFFAVHIGPVQVVELDPGKVRIVVPILEGRKYDTGAIEIDPGFLLDEATVRTWLPLTTGSPYDALAVRKTVERIENAYRDGGYAAVQVRLGERPELDQIRLSFEVIPGLPYSFGRIQFNGNTWLRDRFLRKYLSGRESDRFSRRAVEIDVQALNSLGLLLSVTPETRLSREPLEVDVDYVLQERPRFEYFVGGSSNGLEGTFGAGSLIGRDLLGRGETWSFEGDLGNRLGNLRVIFQDPFTLGHRLTWGGSFVRQKIEYPDETGDDQASFALQMSGPTGSRWQFQSGFQWTRFTLRSDLTTPAPFLTTFLDQRFQANQINFALGYEDRNQPLFPTQGRYFNFGTGVAGGALGGDVSLFELSARAQQLIPLDGSHRHVISLRGRLASVWPFGETEAEGLPRFERLFLGSEDDMRGFPIRRVGPVTPDGVPIGGDRLIYGSAEYQLVVASRARLVGFFDGGNVYATDWPEPRLPRFHFDAGGELRVIAPILNFPLRFGYGYNLDPLPSEPRGRWFFSFSARF